MSDWLNLIAVLDFDMDKITVVHKPACMRFVLMLQSC